MTLLLRGFLSSGVPKAVKESNFYDIVIVGGGMVGFSLAAMAGIGAWDFIERHRAQPVKLMKIWETQSDAQLMFKKDPLAYIVENNLVIESLKQVEAFNNSNVTIKYESQAKNIKFPSPGHPDELIQLDIQSNGHDDQSVQTSLLIGADGYKSTVREAAQLPVIGWSHHQKAVVATLEMDETNEPFTAWQRFLPTGPLALLPLSKNHTSLVWSTTTPEADRLMSITEGEFVNELNQALTNPSPSSSVISKALSKVAGTTLNLLDQLIQTNQICAQDRDSDVPASTTPCPPQIKTLQPGTKRACFPLGFQHATFYSGPRVALVGDAAHRILPLAGQGVNLGFGDAISLIKHVEQALLEGADIGNSTLLQDYTTQRQRVVVPLAATMELINLIYSTDMLRANSNLILSRLSELKFAPIMLRPLFHTFTELRSVGMSALQSSALIKNLLMNVAITGNIQSCPSENASD